MTENNQSAIFDTFSSISIIPDDDPIEETPDGKISEAESAEIELHS